MLATISAKYAEARPHPHEIAAKEREQRRTEAATFLADMFDVTNRDIEAETEAEADGEAAMAGMFKEMGTRLHEAADAQSMINHFGTQNRR